MSDKKSNIVLSTSARFKNCCMFCTGFPLYLPTFAVAPEVPPVIVSPVTNLEFADMNSFELEISGLKIVALAPEVEPVIISPKVNAEAKLLLSNKGLVPSSFIILKSIKEFSVSNNIS